jgi:hypothetical protein
VREGATLYISFDGGQITDFPEIVGAASDGFLAGKDHTIRIGEQTLSYKGKEILLSPKTAEVLLENEEKNPVLLKNRYGKGCVYFCNFSPETIAFAEPDGFNDRAFYEIYRIAAEEAIQKKPLTAEHPSLGISVHPESEDGCLVSILNYSDKEILPSLKIQSGRKILDVLYGDPARIPACNGVILRLGYEK